MKRLNPLPPDVTAFLGPLGPDAEVLKQAMRLGAERAAAVGCGLMTMAVPALGNLQGMIENLFGDAFTRVLRRDYQVDLRGLVVHLATERRPPGYRGPIVALFTTPKQTRALLFDRHATDVIFVPWTEDDVAQFLNVVPDAQRF
jgi:hypothetical protein